MGTKKWYREKWKSFTIFKQIDLESQKWSNFLPNPMLKSIHNSPALPIRKWWSFFILTSLFFFVPIVMRLVSARSSEENCFCFFDITYYRIPSPVSLYFCCFPCQIYYYFWLFRFLWLCFLLFNFRSLSWCGKPSFLTTNRLFVRFSR